MNETKILIVEDDLGSAKVLDLILKKIGCEVLGVVSSSESAIAFLESNSPDLIMMDIGIEGDKDGIETATAIRRIKDIPVIYLTASTNQKTVTRAMQTDPYGYIVKPFNEQNVAVALELGLYKAKLHHALKTSQRRLAITLDALQETVMSTNLEGIINYINPAACILLAANPLDLLGKSITDVLQLHYRNSEAIVNPLQMYHADTRLFEVTRHYSLKIKNGKTLYIRLSKTQSVDTETGSKNGFVFTLSDVTREYHADKKMRMMAAALESIEDAVIVTDINQDRELPSVFYVNNAFTRITQFTKKEIQGSSIKAIFGEKTSDVLKDHIYDNNLDIRGEFINYKKDGQEFHGLWSSANVYSDDGGLAYHVFTVQDVSQMRKLEDNISRTQKIEAVGRLAGGIAHDFNNLLAVITAYIELILLKIKEEDPNYKYAKNIHDAAAKGKQFVDQLMIFSRRQSNDPVRIDVSKAVLSTKEMLSRVFPKNIEFITAIESNVPEVFAEPSHLDQILLNLCVNARDAMPDGGKIHIALQQVDIARVPSLEHDKQKARYVHLSVTDTGSGMDASTLKHIFDPFFTTKPVGQGTGLGLATVYGIIKQCNGTIDVKSEPGKGTTFDVFLPIAETETADTWNIAMA